MRKTLVIIAVLIVLLVAYSAWPFFDLFALVRAVEARDLPAIGERIDFPALRRSLADQLVRTYLRVTGRDRNLNPLARNVVAGTAGAFLDPIVARLLTSEAVAELLRNGWPKDLLPEAPGEAAGLSSQNIGSLWQLYWNAEYGLGRFRIFVPPQRPPAQRFHLSLRLSGWTWKVDGIEMPEPIRLRIAEEFLKTHPEQR